MLTDDEIENIVANEIQDATGYYSGEIEAEQSAALKYYMGEPFGTEREGRSKVVLRDVADSVDAMMPALMKMFFAGEHVGEYKPRSAEDVPFADQATEFVNYILNTEADGYRVFYDWFKTALIQKLGVVKVWCEEKTSVETENHSGISPMAAEALAADPDVEAVEVEVDEETGVLELTIKKRHTERKYCVQNVVPDQFLINRRAVSLEDSDFVGDWQLMTKGQLVELGYDEDVVKELPHHDDIVVNENEYARWADDEGTDIGDEIHWSMTRVRVTDAYVKVDHDDDGHATVLRCVMAGVENPKMLDWEEVSSDFPYALLCPFPIPGKVYGESLADKVMDLQLIRSTILRNTLDNSYQSTSPQKVIVEGQANVNDAIEQRLGGLVRVKRPDAYRHEVMPFIGGQMFPLLEYLDQVREDRTGINKQMSGADPSALQRQSATAANLLFNGAVQRPELVARTFAETGVKRLFRLLLDLICRHQDRPRMVRLRNTFVEMDPRLWNPNYDVTINVGLGYGNTDQKLQHLNTVLERQIQALTAGGLGGMVTPQHVYHTLADMLAIVGLKDVDKYFSQPGQMQPQQEQPDPALIEAQSKIQVAQFEAQQKAALAKWEAEQEAALDQWKAMQQMSVEAFKAGEKTQAEMLKMEADAYLKRQELEYEKVLEREKMKMDRRDGQGNIPRPN